MENLVNRSSFGQIHIQKTARTGAEMWVGEHEIARLKPGRQPVRITALSGALWITRSGEPADHILEAGQSLSLTPSKLTLVEGLSDSKFRVVELS